MPDRLTKTSEPAVAPPRCAISNSYCKRLDLPVPSVEQVAAKPGVKLFHLMVVTLLERGEPLPLIAIAKRLRVAGVTAASGDMEKSLLRSWHGSKAVYRDDRGFLRRTSVHGNSVPSSSRCSSVRGAPSVDAEPKIEPVADEVPLTEKEVRAAFEAASYSNLSRFRRIAAVLDVRGEPMDLSEVATCVTAWGSSQTDVQIQDFRQWTTPCVLVMDGGLLQIDRQSPNLFTMRRAVRKLAERPVQRAAINEQVRHHRRSTRHGKPSSGRMTGSWPYSCGVPCCGWCPKRAQ